MWQVYTVKLFFTTNRNHIGWKKINRISPDLLIEKPRIPQQIIPVAKINKKNANQFFFEVDKQTTKSNFNDPIIINVAIWITISEKSKSTIWIPLPSPFILNEKH